MTGFVAGLGSLFGGGTTPEEQQRAAIFQAGLAALASAQQPGGTFGGSLFSGLQAGAGALQQAQQNAFQAKQLKNREEREDRLEEQQNARIKLEQDAAKAKAREQGASVAQRVSSGIGKAKGRELDYFNVVRNTPEFAELAAQYNLDPGSITSPEQVVQLGQQLGALGGVGAPPPSQQNTPADIASYQFYQSLTPEQQQKFLEVKRNSQPFKLDELEGGKIVFNRVTGKFDRLSTADQEADAQARLEESKATATTVGKGVGEAQLDLQRVADNAAQARKAIADAKASPGFDRIFGVLGVFPNFPGGPAANAQTRLDQIKGKTFLEAFNSLKGAGQITEIEGQKGTDAIARLQQTQSANEARIALDELEQVIAAGEARARQKALGVRKPAQRDFGSMSDADLLKEIGGG